MIRTDDNDKEHIITDYIWELSNRTLKSMHFGKWQNADIKVIIDAYHKRQDLHILQQIQNKRKQFYHASGLIELRKFVKGETDKFIAYIEKQNTNFHSYNDYKRACEYLGMNMTIPKNRYLHDFKRWHDIRIAEYHSKQAKRDEETLKAFYDTFSAVAQKYETLEFEKTEFVCIIAKFPKELIAEGDLLHRCVGRMRYDQKFVDEKSLIFLIRTKDNPDTPLVTMEYSITDKKVLQCYGDHDEKPSEEILEFVNKKWLPYAKRQMKKIAA